MTLHKGLKNITVSPGTHHDAARCGTLAKDCPPLVAHEDFAYWTLLIGFPNGTLIARDGDRDIGFICSLLTQNDQMGRLIWQVGVLEEYRRYGVASLLLNSLQEYFPNERVASASIDPQNTPSMQLFENFATQHGGRMRCNRAISDDLSGTPVAAYGELIYTLEMPEC